MMINYLDSRPTLRSRITSLFGQKARGDAPDMVMTDYRLPSPTWRLNSARSYFREGYKLNSAVFACTRALATGFAEAPLRCYEDDTKKKELPSHPLQSVIKRPNPYMGEDEFWKALVVYAANGGDGFGRIVNNNGGEPVEIWPYNTLTTWAVPSRTKWIDHYIYSPDGSLLNAVEIPVEEMMHFKWDIDPEQPWHGMAALTSVSREVDTDNELTRYLKALLENDATPRTALKFPPGRTLSIDQMDEQERIWRSKFGRGGTNRGGIGFLLNGAELVRVSLNMDELAFAALRSVPEARIAAAYGVPAIVAGLNVGLERSTYANFAEARRMFTERVLMPLWKAMASEIQHSLVPLFRKPCYVDFDLSKVLALNENTRDAALWVVNAWRFGLLNRNQALARLGEASIEGPLGLEFAPPASASSGVGVSLGGGGDASDASKERDGNGKEHSELKELVAP